MEPYRDRIRSMGLAILGTLALLLLGLVCFWRSWERPPETTAGPVVQPAPATGARTKPELGPAAETSAPGEDEEQLPTGEALWTARQDGVYTILLVGSDDGNGNTDTLILGRLDTLRHEMDFVSIPRDTLVNLPWEVRKINAVYWGSRLGGGDGITELKRQIARLTGFEPDCYAVVDLDLFVQAVDCVGGVSFDVPMAMDYEDPSQDLRIHLKPGPQVLDGEAAMGLCRYRSGYVTGDLGRIEMQQRFLRACAEQFLSLGSIPRAPKLLSLLAENLETDLSAANMAFLLRQFLACREENVRFCTAPCTPEIISGYSYAVLDLEKWLETVNQRLNPFETPIGPEQLDLVYRSGGGFAGTAGLRDAGYYLPAPAPAPVSASAEDGAASEARIAAAPAESEGEKPTIIVIEP